NIKGFGPIISPTFPQNSLTELYSPRFKLAGDSCPSSQANAQGPAKSSPLSVRMEWARFTKPVIFSTTCVRRLHEDFAIYFLERHGFDDVIFSARRGRAAYQHSARRIRCPAKNLSCTAHDTRGCGNLDLVLPQVDSRRTRTQRAGD